MTDERGLTIASDIFPDAHAVFTWRVKPLDSIMDSCLFVLDTSVLLIPYEVGPQPFNDIEASLRKLVHENRVRIPGQAAREFARRRPTLLMSVLSDVNNRKSRLERIQPRRLPLLESITEYQEALGIEKEVNGLIGRYQAFMATVSTKVKSWEWNDPVSSFYHELFDQSVVSDIEVEIGELKKDLEWRKQYSVPPGYKDSTKSDNAAGDLLIWKTMLHIGKSEKRDIVFVTAEVKGDWWHRSDDVGIYPRYELQDEFRRATGGRSFQITSMSKILKRFGASQETIDDVQREENTPTGEISLSRVVNDWSAIRADIKTSGSHGRRIEALLQQVDPAAVLDGTLLLVSPYEFHRNRLNDENVQRTISDALETRYGIRMLISVTSRLGAASLLDDEDYYDDDDAVAP